MRTSDVVDLPNERRLSAVLDFSSHGAELLVLNGGSRAEEVLIETLVFAPQTRTRRAVYCLDVGTSVRLVFPLLADEKPEGVAIRITGGPSELLLAPPPRANVFHRPVMRGGASLAAAAALLFVLGGHIDPSLLAVNVTPEPALADPPLIVSKVHLLRDRRLPTVIAGPMLALRRSGAAHDADRDAVRDVSTASRASSTASTTAWTPSLYPVPRMTNLRVPLVAKSGDIISVAYNAIASKVRIVASIGPTVVARRTVTEPNGTIAIRPPTSGLGSRVMTIRAYAQNGKLTSYLQRMVVLIPS